MAIRRVEEQALVRRWSQLYPASAPTGAPAADERELLDVRRALAQEFDAALGFIERLGYNLDDHYHAVRHVVAPSTPAPAPSKSRITPRLAVRFVLDSKGRPQYSKKEQGYWLQAWLENAPERTASVVWRMHSSNGGFRLPARAATTTPR